MDNRVRIGELVGRTITLRIIFSDSLAQVAIDTVRSDSVFSRVGDWELTNDTLIEAHGGDYYEYRFVPQFGDSPNA